MGKGARLKKKRGLQARRPKNKSAELLTKNFQKEIRNYLKNARLK
jgi:hypothetical protein